MKAKRKWRKFTEARVWAREQHLSSGEQWSELKKQNKLPIDIPAAPAYVYRDKWKGWGDFLGTGYVASQNRTYRSFDDTRKWARARKLKSYREWTELSAKKKLPSDIPANVKQVYRYEWRGTADFLGNSYVATYNRKYRFFAQAREWARTHGLKSEKEWREYSKRPGWLPGDIPVNVYNVYRKDWTSWGDFLGSGYIANQKRHYRSFEKAREWAHEQGLKSCSDWNRHVKQPGWPPSDIPADPHSAYGSEFTSWGDFLSTGNLSSREYNWRDFNEARAWAQEQQIDSMDEWYELARSAKAAKQWPEDIPINADALYMSKGWKGWEDFLGIQRMAKRSKVEERLRHELASVIPAIDLAVRRIPVPGAMAKNVDMCAPTLHLVVEFDGNYWHGTKDSETRDRAKTQILQNAGWTVVRIRENPLDLISSNDVRVPAKQRTFNRTVAVLKHLSALGYVTQDAVERYEAGGRVMNGDMASKRIREKWRPFPEAQAWVQAQGIKSQRQWSKHLKKEGWLPRDIPRYPLEVYKDQCATWGIFLGTGYVVPFQREYRTFEEAREWARAKHLKSQTGWKARTKQEGWLPKDIPVSVHNVYKDKWISWGDFLGTGNVAPGNHHWRSFTSARRWARKQQLSSRDSWHKLYENNAVPRDIPAAPQAVYASEWAGWRDFLGETSQKIARAQLKG